MARGFQQVLIVGNLGREPEMRYTQGGKSVTSFSVAVTTGSGDYEHTEWFSCTAWDKLGEIVNEYCSKGSQVQVVGTLKTEEYEKDGEKKKIVRLTARDVLLLGSKNSNGNGDTEQPERQQPGKYVPPGPQKAQRNVPVAVDDSGEIPF